MSYRKRKITVMDVPADFVPSYKRPNELKAFISGRGKIASRARTGLSQKRQKHLAREIKRARQLALLPFVTVFK